MNTVYKLFENFFLLTSAMSFYILIGLLIAGVLKQIVPSDFVSKHLGKNSFLSVIKATIFGVPLPVCSCSVIPLAKSLEKEGASRGAVQSFLISTPITGVDSIAATYSFFGWFFTIYRVVTSVVIAIIVGLIENAIGSKEKINKTKGKTCGCCSDSCSDTKESLGKWCSAFTPITTNKSLTNSTFAINIPKKVVENSEESNCCSSGNCCEDNTSNKFTISFVFDYAFNTLFKDIAKSLLVGLIIGALFTTFLPKDFLVTLYSNEMLTYFMVLIVAMPLYVCATSSLPIAAAFMLSGMSPGAAFVFLSAGPATNTITMGVVAQMFGKKSLAIYVGVIATLSILFGYLYDKFYGNLEVLKITKHIEDISVVNSVSSVIMLGLILYYLIKR